jgi:hypothetical protein
MNFYFIHKVSTVACTSFQDLIFLKFCYDICFRHFLSYLYVVIFFLRLYMNLKTIIQANSLNFNQTFTFFATN